MSLFVGNISKNVRQYELEDQFNKFGKCSIKQKVTWREITQLAFYCYFSPSTDVNLSFSCLFRARLPSSNSRVSVTLKMPRRASKARTWAVSKSLLSGVREVEDSTPRTAADPHRKYLSILGCCRISTRIS